MEKSFLALLLLTVISCGGKPGPKTYPLSEVSFAKYVNDKELPRNPNLSIDKSIMNNDYPVQLAFYKDQRFYYDLPNLDDGTGTWSYQNGQIVLKSKHRLFNMRIDVHALNKVGSELAIKFIDRHGHQTLKMDNSNLE